MIDVSTARNARYTTPDHTEFSVELDGHVTSGCRPVPGLMVYDALIAAGITIQDYTAPPVDLAAYAMTKRDQVIDSGITFGGVRYQTRLTDRENISGAALLALMATIAGAQAGDLRWHGGDSDFEWIAESNSKVPMDAPTVIALGKAAAARKQALIFAARSIKDGITAGTITTTNQVDAAFAAI